MGLFDFLKKENNNYEEESKWKNKLIEWGKEYRIKNFPRNEYDLLELKRIDFSDWTYAFEDYKKIYNLPTEICKLKNLRVLYLGSMYNNDQIQCELSELPECIGDLYNLEELYISNQYKLKSLPRSIGKLKNLKKLIMFNIDISLPEEITNLTNLDEIYLPVSNLSVNQNNWIKKLKMKGCKIDDDNQTGEYNPISDITAEINDVLNETYENSNYINDDKDYDEYNLWDEEYEEESILDDCGIEYIYHMTHYKNLENILENGLLSHNNEYVNEHIDNEDVNDRRDKIEPINEKNLHSYVPFYFNPKNPMLYVNKEIQEDIVILAFDRNLLYKNKTIFTDGNASVSRTNFYYDLDDLQQLNWDCLNDNYWNHYEEGKRERMAEVLVRKKVKIKHLKKIYCYDEATKSFILDLDDELDVEINTKLYF